MNNLQPRSLFGTFRAGDTFERAVEQKNMAASTEEDIRKRAYHLWKSAGEPVGNPDEFWNQGEKEIMKENAELGDLPPGMADNLPV